MKLQKNTLIDRQILDWAKSLKPSPYITERDGIQTVRSGGVILVANREETGELVGWTVALEVGALKP